MFPIILSNVPEPVYLAIWNKCSDDYQKIEIHTKESFWNKYKDTNLYFDSNLYDERKDRGNLSMHDVFSAIDHEAYEDFEDDNFYIRRIK
jgi:hypothetical protein